MSGAGRTGRDEDGEAGGATGAERGASGTGGPRGADGTPDGTLDGTPDGLHEPGDPHEPGGSRRRARAARSADGASRPASRRASGRRAESPGSGGSGVGGGVRGQAEGMGERREGDGTAGPSCVTYTSFGVTGIDPLLGDHRLLRSLLGAWALAACSPKEALAVETHLGVCGACADEALRLRDAVGLLHPQEPLDLDPSLRARVLARCLERRPPRVPVPAWAEPYDTETARLDALLQSLGDSDWHAPVRLRWWTPEGPTGRRTTVAGVIAHLLAVDGLVAAATGLPDPLGAHAPGMPVPPEERTERYLAALGAPPTRAEHAPWREQTHALVRTAGLPDGEDGGSGGTPVPYGGFSLPLRDALLERAFETWIHAWDIATAVSYPYAAPAGPHLRLLIDLATRLVPQTLAAFPPPDAEPRSGGRGTLRLEIEGPGGGVWRIGVDPKAESEEGPYEDVAEVRLDGVEFCELAAGHLAPEEAALGQDGDRATILRVLRATAALSRV
ncbi:maleylpyruvate isomerase N-terminal domain-containing protein [Streptomyces evansiae]|uniref:maleylpyruvate isomerase N-terminal domain-containing protein n=1 Tax=Streptomyces evansiae TaxID=3075535 RepID=UPI0037D9BC4B